MTPPFIVEFDFAARTLRMTCNGMWTNAILDAFEREMDETLVRYRALGGTDGMLLTLVDLRKNMIQTQEITARLQEQNRRNSPISKRAAILLSPSAIQRSQAKRVVPSDNRRFFVDEAEAVAWLEEARVDLPLAG